MMIRTTIIGLLFLFAMLGMNASSMQGSCALTCSTPCFMMFLQTTSEEQRYKDAGEVTKGQGRKRPDRIKPRSDGRNAFSRERQMPANMVEHVMAVAMEVDPELAEQLKSMCEKDPDAFNKIIRRQGRRMGSLIHLRESDPELFEVKVTELKTDAEIYHVAQNLKGQDPDNPSTQARIAELEGLVRVKTAISIRAQALYIERLEQHLAGLRERQADTSERFDEIVAKRLQQLLQVTVDEKPDLTSQSD